MAVPPSGKAHVNLPQGRERPRHLSLVIHTTEVRLRPHRVEDARGVKFRVYFRDPLPHFRFHRFLIFIFIVWCRTLSGSVASLFHRAQLRGPELGDLRWAVIYRDSRLGAGVKNRMH